MNWKAVGALSEIIVSCAVVMTLPYLAKHVRDRKTATHAATHFEVTEAVNSIYLAIAKDPQLFQLYQTGNQDPSKLSGDDLARYMIATSGIFARYNNFYPQYKNGTLPEEPWRIAERAMTTMMAHPGVRLW